MEYVEGEISCDALRTNFYSLSIDKQEEIIQSLEKLEMTICEVVMELGEVKCFNPALAFRMLEMEMGRFAKQVDEMTKEVKEKEIKQ